MTEAQLQRAVIDLARWTGWLVHHARTVQAASGRWQTALQGDTGAPDLLLAHPRHGTLYVELKAAKGRLSDQQQRWRNTLEPTGRYRLWRPADWNDIQTTLTKGPTATHDHHPHT